MDAAGTRVKLRQTPLPEDVCEVQKWIKFIVQRMENAIVNHEFEKARLSLREKYHLDQSPIAIVGREVVEEVVSRWG